MPASRYFQRTRSPLRSAARVRPRAPPPSDDLHIARKPGMECRPALSVGGGASAATISTVAPNRSNVVEPSAIFQTLQGGHLLGVVKRLNKIGITLSSSAISLDRRRAAAFFISWREIDSRDESPPPGADQDVVIHLGIVGSSNTTPTKALLIWCPATGR